MCTLKRKPHLFPAALKATPPLSPVTLLSYCEGDVLEAKTISDTEMQYFLQSPVLYINAPG